MQHRLCWCTTTAFTSGTTSSSMSVYMAILCVMCWLTAGLFRWLGMVHNAKDPMKLTVTPGDLLMEVGPSSCLAVIA